MGTFRSLWGIKVWLVCNDYRGGGEGLDASPPNIHLKILVIQIECNSIGDSSGAVWWSILRLEG